MGQFGKFLRRCNGGHSHWCPGCKRMHIIYDTWQFNGSPDSPTFSPSIKIEGMRTIRDEQGRWLGEWERDEQGKPIPYVCHYFVVNAQIQFCGDSTHALAGQTVPLPELPAWMRDWKDDDPNLI